MAFLIEVQTGHGWQVGQRPGSTEYSPRVLAMSLSVVISHPALEQPHGKTSPETKMDPAQLMSRSGSRQHEAAHIPGPAAPSLSRAATRHTQVSARPPCWCPCLSLPLVVPPCPHVTQTSLSLISRPTNRITVLGTRMWACLGAEEAPGCALREASSQGTPPE